MMKYQQIMVSIILTRKPITTPNPSLTFQLPLSHHNDIYLCHFLRVSLCKYSPGNFLTFLVHICSPETAIGLSDRGHLRGESQQVPSEDRPTPQGEERGPPSPETRREVETMPEECGASRVVATRET